MKPILVAGQSSDNLHNDMSTFRTTQMANLLLVDDEPKLIFKQVSHVFAPRGYQIELVRSGSEAISHVAKGQTDVVLLDVVLPDMGGLEVHERIRQIDARIPVIFVTQTTNSDTAIESLRQRN